jgi:hypothetical protein
VVSTAIVVERQEDGHAYPVQRPVYFVSEVLSESKARYHTVVAPLRAPMASAGHRPSRCCTGESRGRKCGAVNVAVCDRLGSTGCKYTCDYRGGSKQTDLMHPVARMVLFSPPNTAKQAPTVQPKYICRLPIRI